MRAYVDGSAALYKKRYKIGGTVVANQVVVSDPATNAAATGDVISPGSVTDYSKTVGVVVGPVYPNILAVPPIAYTYITTANPEGDTSPDRIVEVVCVNPMTHFEGRACGGATGSSGTPSALAKALNGNWLVDTGTSKTVISDTNVGTSEFVGGMIIAFNGANANYWRRISSHIDNASTTVSVPFGNAPVANDEFVRIPGVLDSKGIRLTSDFTEFNIAPGAGVDMPDTGNAVVVDFRTDFSGPTPVVFLEVVFPSHLFITN